jgi:hypothetical protein
VEKPPGLQYNNKLKDVVRAYPEKGNLFRGDGMKVVTQRQVEIAMRTLDDEERREIIRSFHHLQNWENDAHVRNASHKLDGTENVYVLKATDDFRIFFTIQGNTATILDIASKSTITRAGLAG